MTQLKVYLRCLTFGLIVGILAIPSFAKLANGKEILLELSWGDEISYYDASHETPMNSNEAFLKAFRKYKQDGVDAVLFRVDVLRWVTDYDWPEPRTLAWYKTGAPPRVLVEDERQWEGSYIAVKDNLLKNVVTDAHKIGLKIYVYSTTFDEGLPANGIWYAAGEHGRMNVSVHKPWTFPGNTYGPLISKFTEAHPEYVMVDRSQKHHNWGTLQFAYPEARAYVVGYNRRFLEEYPFDGVYIDFRDEFAHPEFGDQFGFAPPIVEAYQKRYGVNILKENFDLEKWRRLCGEYLTEMIRELHGMVHSRGKKLIVGIPQGNYMGPPIGNMYVDWQQWVKEHIVDGLVIGAITGKFVFPDRVGYGYLTDPESGAGLPNLLWDLQNNYWPLCASHKVKLYVDRVQGGPAKKIPLSQFEKTNIDGFFVSRSF